MFCARFPSFTLTLKIDKTVPSATTSTVNSTPNSSGYYNGANGAVKLTLSAGDTPAANGYSSGLAGYYVSATGAQTYTRQFVPASNPTITLADGTTTLTYNSVDKAGNEGATASRTLKVDTTAPVTTTSTMTVNGGKVQVTVNYSDNASGYVAYKFTVNGGALQTYAGPFTTPAGSFSITLGNSRDMRGTYTVRYYGTDAAGNNEAPKTVTFTVGK